MSTLLEINGLYTSFGRDETEVKAVRDVSLKIEKGETHALVGESGSGKSVTALSDRMRRVPSSPSCSACWSSLARRYATHSIRGRRSDEHAS